MTEINLFATFPISGTYTLNAGQTHIDLIQGVVTVPDGTIVPMAKRTLEDHPLKHLWIDCSVDINVEVRHLGEVQYVGRVMKNGFSFQGLIYDEITITTTVSTDIQLIGSSSLIANVGGSSSGGGGGIISTVGSDIDGDDAQTTNSLIYGRSSAGVTHPVHTNTDGDLMVVTTPGAVLSPTVVTTALCAAGAAIEFDISFADLATVKQVQVEQLTSGNYDYTFEIWKSATYTPGTISDHYLKALSRDVDKQEWSENIDGGLIYQDFDAGQELHCRISNRATGTSSTFNVSIIGIEG